MLFSVNEAMQPQGEAEHSGIWSPDPYLSSQINTLSQILHQCTAADSNYKVVLMWFMKNRSLSEGSGTFLVMLWDFPGCGGFTPPPPLSFFYERELSPLHNMNTCCDPPTPWGSLKTSAGWSFPPSSCSFTPTSTYPHYISHSSSLSPLPFPTVPYHQSAAIEQAFHRPSHRDQWPHQWAGSQRVQVPPVRVIPHISLYLIQQSEEGCGPMGVWSPHATLFFTIRPCHIIMVITWPPTMTYSTLEGE